MLGLPPKPANAVAARGDVIDACGSPPDTIPVSIRWIFERDDGFVRDGLHQASAKYRNRNAARDYVCLYRNLDLAVVGGRRE